MKNKMEIKKKNTINGFIISFHRRFFVQHLEQKNNMSATIKRTKTISQLNLD